MPFLKSCDICGRDRFCRFAGIHSGIETWVCVECLGLDESDISDEQYDAELSAVRAAVNVLEG